MRFDWDLEPEWWLAVAVAALLVVVLLVLAVVAYSSYRGMRRQRDETRKRLDLARQELADIRIELDEARRDQDRVLKELDEARRDQDRVLKELDEARRDWHDAIRQFTPRLREQAGKISEVLEGLARWQEDRKKLGLGGGWELRAVAVMKASQEEREKAQEAMANFRRMANNSFSALKRLIERPAIRSGDDAKEENPQAE